MVAVLYLNRFVDEGHVLQKRSSEDVLPCLADSLYVLAEELGCLDVL